MVSSVSGVDAKIQTPPDSSLIAVERPPTGTNAKSVNGLQSGVQSDSPTVRPSGTACSMLNAYRENVQTFGTTW